MIEHVEMKTARELDLALFQKLAAGVWIEQHSELADHRQDRSRQELDRVRSRTSLLAITVPRSTTGWPRLFDALTLRSAIIRSTGCSEAWRAPSC